MTDDHRLAGDRGSREDEPSEDDTEGHAVAGPAGSMPGMPLGSGEFARQPRPGAGDASDDTEGHVFRRRSSASGE